jgi:hypothetical protein
LANELATRIPQLKQRLETDEQKVAWGSANGNIHLKFPFAVVGGVLVIPTYEQIGTKAAQEAEKLEEVVAEDSDDLLHFRDGLDFPATPTLEASTTLQPRKSTVHLIGSCYIRIVAVSGKLLPAGSRSLNGQGEKRTPPNWFTDVGVGNNLDVSTR